MPSACLPAPGGRKTLPFRFQPWQLIRHIRTARKYILLVSLYFMPGRLLRRMLYRAACRGVRVEIVIPKKSDMTFADYVADTYLRRLIMRGIHVYHYLPGMIHSKISIVDEWATVGSMNLDHLSILRNREQNLLINEPLAVRQLTDQFQSDLADCERITLHQLKRIPFYRWLLGHVGSLFRKMM